MVDEVKENEVAKEGEGEKSAEEWAGMVADKEKATNKQDSKVVEDVPSKILNQAEIDNLLGFKEAEDDNEDRTGIKAILNSGMVSYERLPMLEIVFDRLVRMMSTSLRNFTQDNVEVAIDDIVSMRFGEYLNSIPLPTMIAVFKAEEWDNFGLMTVDSSLTYSIVDVLLGGRRGTAAMRIEGRAYTTIERNLIERMVHVIFADLSAAFDPISPVTFRFDRLDTNPRFASISRPSNAVIVAKLRIDMEDRGGRLELMIPYATLEPVRELLLQMFMGEKFGRDSIWETHLVEELWQTELDVNAVLEEQVMNLSKVTSWEVGSQMLLGATTKTDVKMYCGDIPLVKGNMGRKGSNIAIRVTDKIKGKR